MMKPKQYNYCTTAKYYWDKIESVFGSLLDDELEPSHINSWELLHDDICADCSQRRKLEAEKISTTPLLKVIK